GTREGGTMLKIEKVGRRIYVLGDSYPFRRQLRAAGCKWDADRHQWWIGSTKLDVLERLIAEINAHSGDIEERRQADRLEADRRHILGRAEYKGRTYYVVWRGQTRRGDAVKLLFRDGSKTFWADAGEV